MNNLDFCFCKCKCVIIFKVLFYACAVATFQKSCRFHQEGVSAFSIDSISGNNLLTFSFYWLWVPLMWKRQCCLRVFHSGRLSYFRSIRYSFGTWTFKEIEANVLCHKMLVIKSLSPCVSPPTVQKHVAEINCPCDCICCLHQWPIDPKLNCMSRHSGRAVCPFWLMLNA